MKCLYCEKEFKIIPTGSSGGQNRQLCYECLPEGTPRNICTTRARELLKLKAVKQKEQLGCSICGYNKNGAALEWHHLNPKEKDDDPANYLNKSNKEGWEEYQKEIKKCILVCANCHREIHFPKIDFKKVKGSNANEEFRQLVKKTYEETNNINETARKLNKNIQTIANILHYYNIDTSKPIYQVKMINKNTKEVLKIFKTASEAAEYVSGKKSNNSHIIAVCNGRRKTAYGYLWEYDK